MEWREEEKKNNDINKEWMDDIRIKYMVGFLTTTTKMIFKWRKKNKKKKKQDFKLVL